MIKHTNLIASKYTLNIVTENIYYRFDKMTYSENIRDAVYILVLSYSTMCTNILLKF